MNYSKKIFDLRRKKTKIEASIIVLRSEIDYPTPNPYGHREEEQIRQVAFFLESKGLEEDSTEANIKLRALSNNRFQKEDRITDLKEAIDVIDDTIELLKEMEKADSILKSVSSATVSGAAWTPSYPGEQPPKEL